MNIIKRADMIVNKRSEEHLRQYGDFIKSMERTAAMASLMRDKPIDATDAYCVMIALKFSREACAHKEDNLLDAIAYIGSLNNYANERRNHAKRKRSRAQ